MSAHLKYLSYVLRHKWFVLVAGLKTGAPLWRLLIHDWSKFLPCEWGPYTRTFYTAPRVGERVGGVADGAPFDGVVINTRPASEVEARGFTPVDCFVRDDQGREWWAWSFEIQQRHDVDAAFDRAWLHHQKANAHHWQCWVLMEDQPRRGPYWFNETAESIRASGADWKCRTIPVPAAARSFAHSLITDANRYRALRMPEALVREMVADWMGAGRAITGRWDVAAWYQNNRENMVLHRDTRARVEALISTCGAP